MTARKRGSRKALPQPQQPPSGEPAAASAAQPQQQGLRPSAEEVVLAVESLYSDQLKPSGRILRKRVAERASGLGMEDIYVAPSQALLPEIDVGHLKATCEDCAALRMEADEGGDWSVVLVGREAEFVDVHSVEDFLPPQLWSAAEAYFLSLREPERTLPGGRYACAQALAGRKLDFLRGYSLGQVCHIVQLAISERKLLGYCNGTVVPYGHSQSMLKERCAERQQPLASAASQVRSGHPAEAEPAMPLATWEVARRLLREILEEATQPGQGPPVVPLSNVKRLFRSRYKTELSETMLGHSRMADLMQDQRFEDLCTLRLQKGGYVVVGKDTSPSNKASPASKTISLAETLQPQGRTGEAVISLASGLQLDFGEAPAQPLRLELCLGRPMRWGDIEDETTAEGVQAPTSLPVATPLPSPGVAGDDAMARWLGEPRQRSLCVDEPLCLEDAAQSSAGMPQALPTPLPSPGEPASATVRRWAAAPRRAEFFPPAATVAEDEGSRGAAEPAAGGSLRLPLAAREEPSGAPPAGDVTPAAAGGWCPDEPLQLEDASCRSRAPAPTPAAPTPLASPGEPGSAMVRRWGWAGQGGGPPRRLEFFADECAPEAAEPPCLLGRTSPLHKPSGGGQKPGLDTGFGEVSRFLEGIPSPQRRTQASRAGRGRLPLAGESCVGSERGCHTAVESAFAHAKLSGVALLGLGVRSQSLPKDLGSNREDSASPASQHQDKCSNATQEWTISTPTPQSRQTLAAVLAGGQRSVEPWQSSRFCLDEPLCLEDVGISLEGGEPTEVQEMPRWLAPSPRESGLKLVVRNTFLHSAPSPVTPAACAVRRSRSLPPGTGQREGSQDPSCLAFKLQPQVLPPIEGKSEGAWAKGGCKPSAADDFPAFMPISPALTASPTERSSWFATALAAGAAQRVVRLADHV